MTKKGKTKFGPGGKTKFGMKKGKLKGPKPKKIMKK